MRTFSYTNRNALGFRPRVIRNLKEINIVPTGYTHVVTHSKRARVFVLDWKVVQNADVYSITRHRRQRILPVFFIYHIVQKTRRTNVILCTRNIIA